MNILQWSVAAITAMFVAVVAFLQWRTAQQKAGLDLFDRRFEIYKAVTNRVDQMIRNSLGFDQERERKFLKAREGAYFFFGDDLHNYLETLWDDIVVVRTFDSQGPERAKDAAKRAQAMRRIMDFDVNGRPLFAKYMRFSQTVPQGVGRQLGGSRRAKVDDDWQWSRHATIPPACVSVMPRSTSVGLPWLRATTATVAPWRLKPPLDRI